MKGESKKKKKDGGQGQNCLRRRIQKKKRMRVRRVLDQLHLNALVVTHWTILDGIYGTRKILQLYKRFPFIFIFSMST